MKWKTNSNQINVKLMVVKGLIKIEVRYIRGAYNVTIRCVKSVDRKLTYSKEFERNDDKGKLGEKN